MLFVNKIHCINNSNIMNLVDLILAFIILLAVVVGWSRGFILGSLDLMTWAGSIVIGYIFYPYTARGLEKIVNLGAWLLPVAFLLTTLVARLLIGFITGYIARTVPENINRSGVNKFLGIIPGAINGWLYAIIFATLFLALPLKDSLTTAARDSRFTGKLAMQSEWANRKLSVVFDKAISQTLNSLMVHPGSSERVSLLFKYNKAVARPGLEEQMLAMVNKERTDRGLKPLKADPELTPVARAHSNDMFVRGYFAHLNPDGKNPFQRMKEANISFNTAGENLALAQTVEIAHTNLMNSPGHKANILNPSFGRVGIGIMDGGFHGLMISQEFRD
jgi:uncharacterized protein YkwD